MLRLPLVMIVIDAKGYLVSMLGARASWVLNAKAAGGREFEPASNAKRLPKGGHDVER